ncbi:MAG: CoA-binding protein [Verrucomicrobiota bacterium]
MNVAIIGASPKPDRFAYKAQQLLTEHGHIVYPVSPSGQDILGRPGFASIDEIPETERPIHTLTIYVNPTRFADIADEVCRFNPSRVIFNPGTESAEIAAKFRDAGIHVVEACTLVLLNEGEFESA